MIIAFELNMPNVGSWNGKWTGADRFHAVTRTVRKLTDSHKAILKKGYFHYNFGDGWSAGVTAKQVNSSEAAKIRRKSQGFCGYEWMVDEIMTLGRIRTLKERDAERSER